MSKERELLERCLDEFQYHEVPVDDLIREIQELLAQPEQEPEFNFDLERMKAAIESPISDVTVDDLAKQVKQKPVAWMYEWYENDLESTQVTGGSEKPFEGEIVQPFNIRPLYASPPKRERINHDDILDRSIDGSFEYRDGFMDGVMFAENHHGIGVDNESI